MPQLHFYDDARARAFEPFALTRPACEMRAGALLLRERWEKAIKLETAGFISSAHLADFDEPGAPHAVAHNAEIPAGAIVINSRCVAPLDLSLEHFDLLMCDGVAGAVRLARAVPAALFAEGSLDLGTIQTSLGGRRLKSRWINEVWDFNATLSQQLQEDIPPLAAALGIKSSRHDAVVGDKGLFIEDGAEVGPHSVLDCSAGPIMIRRAAVVSPFTHLVGPIYVGAESVILGDRVAASSIGETSKIRGELSNTIVIGHSNKAHAGFVGHSYLGRWVNLGALTTTSNLKNTYGTVEMWTPAGARSTGQQLLGTMFGDHVKTGIGTMLNTGTVLGTGANIFGSVMPPKAVAPFAWGDKAPYDTFDLDKFLTVAERVMERRHVKLSDRARRLLAEAHRRRWSA